ncbi:MAG: ubiquinol-cytochrome c reductase iron-sulfur subunit [Nitrospiria bacterium]
MKSKSPNRLSETAEESSQSHEMPRRRFVNFLLGGGLLTTLGAIFVPLVNFIIPPKVQEAVQSSVVAARVGELALNAGKIFRFGSKPGILVRTQNDEYVAFTAICTHLQCTVQYRSDFKHIWCACHNGHFDLTGKNISGPQPSPLEAYNVEIRGEDIVVTKTA